MAGETDVEDYSDLKFYAQYDWQLDMEMRELPLSKGESDEPYIRCRVKDDSKQKRQEQNKIKTA